MKPPLVKEAKAAHSLSAVDRKKGEKKDEVFHISSTEAIERYNTFNFFDLGPT
jgi:hypothetical protein